jgi:hypothetical protein
VRAGNYYIALIYTQAKFAVANSTQSAVLLKRITKLLTSKKKTAFIQESGSALREEN